MITHMNILHEEVAKLTQEIVALRELILNQRNKEPPLNSEVMNLDQVINYIRGKQIPMSKSRLYKLSSSGGIPLRRAGTRLLFMKTEIDTWCEANIIAEQVTSKEKNNTNNNALVTSALNKLKQ